jgi:hypothetical protein
MKEMDEGRYQRLCSVSLPTLEIRSSLILQDYFSTASALHQSEMKDMLMGHMGTVKSLTGGEPNEACEFPFDLNACRC